MIARILAALCLTLIAGVPAHAQQPLQVVPCTPVPSTTGCIYSGAPGGGNAGYPAGAKPITGNATGTTGAVVGTLAAAAGKFTYICGLHVDATGTGAIGPVTLAGIAGSSMVFQATAGAANGIPAQSFTPCVPSSGVNTAITLTTTADGTASAVDVNMWGFQQ